MELCSKKMRIIPAVTAIPSDANTNASMDEADAIGWYSCVSSRQAAERKESTVKSGYPKCAEH